MAGNKVVICGVNTSKLPLLSEDEKRALFARMNAGDKSQRRIYPWKPPTCSECDPTVLRQQHRKLR